MEATSCDNFFLHLICFQYHICFYLETKKRPLRVGPTLSKPPRRIFFFSFLVLVLVLVHFYSALKAKHSKTRGQLLTANGRICMPYYVFNKLALVDSVWSSGGRLLAEPFLPYKTTCIYLYPRSFLSSRMPLIKRNLTKEQHT